MQQICLLVYQEIWLMRTFVSRNEAIEYMKKLGFQSVSELQQSERDKRNESIRKLKLVEDVTIRQLSRLTGISKSIIDRMQGQGTCPHVPRELFLLSVCDLYRNATRKSPLGSVYVGSYSKTPCLVI